jgi:ADP-heptose:LPS heptosyltransferase
MKENFGKMSKVVFYRTLALFAMIFLRRRRKIETDDVKSILVVNLGLIGDALLGTPIILALAEAFGKYTAVSVLTTPASYPALKNNNELEIYVYDAFWADRSSGRSYRSIVRYLRSTFRTVLLLRKRRFDTILNIWPTDQPLNCFFLRTLRSRNVVGYSFNYSKYFYDFSLDFDDASHVVDNQFQLASAYFGEIIRGCFRRELRYFAPPHSKEVKEQIPTPYILISPYSSQNQKNWSEVSWAELISGLVKKYDGFTIVVTGTRDRAIQAQSIFRKSPPGIVNFVGRSSFEEFAVLVEKASLVITVESAAIHLASAFHVPVFVLYSRLYRYHQFLPIGTAYSFAVEGGESAAQQIHQSAGIALSSPAVTRLLDEFISNNLGAREKKLSC